MVHIPCHCLESTVWSIYCLSLQFTFHQRSSYFSPQDPPGSGLLESSVAFSFFHQVCPVPTSVSLRFFTPMPTSPQRRLPSALQYSSVLDHPISSPHSICGELLMRLLLYGHILHIGPPRRLIVVKNAPAHAGDVRDASSISGSGILLGTGSGNPVQYSCMENSMGRGAWCVPVHGVAKSDTTGQLISLIAYQCCVVHDQKPTPSSLRVNPQYLESCLN